MRISSVVLSLLAPMPADDNLYLKLTLLSKAEGVSLSAQNVSGKPIVASGHPGRVHEWRRIWREYFDRKLRLSPRSAQMLRN